LFFFMCLSSLCLQEKGAELNKKEVYGMELESNSFESEGLIPSRYTCDGQDISPHLKWSKYPDETKSFALTCVDPDAPMGEFIHWLVYNIPANVSELNEGKKAPGKEVTNDFKRLEYGGPCPPSGTHRYFFTVYALDREMTEDLSRDNFRERVEEHSLAKAVLMGRYSRR